MFNTVCNFVANVLALEHSSKIGDLLPNRREQAQVEITTIVAQPVLNNGPVPLPSAPPAVPPVAILVGRGVSRSTFKKRRRQEKLQTEQKPQLPVVAVYPPQKVFNFNRFASRIRRGDAHGGAQVIEGYVQGPSRDLLLARASVFLSRLQQVPLSQRVHRCLFSVSRLGSVDRFVGSIPPPKFQTPLITDLTRSESFEFKRLYKRSKNGDAVASFKLFQLYWTDNSDLKRWHGTALHFLGQAKQQGLYAAEQALTLIYKAARSNLHNAYVVRIIITNMHPCAQGILLTNLYSDFHTPHDCGEGDLNPEEVGGIIKS